MTDDHRPPLRFLLTALDDPEIHARMRAQIHALDPDGSYAAARADADAEERFVREVLIPAIQKNVQAEIDRIVRDVYDYSKHDNLDRLRQRLGGGRMTIVDHS